MHLLCRIAFAALATFLLMASPGRAETPEEWVKLGARVHGAFGSFIPVGIRIGLDAIERLKPEPRSLMVVYYSGEKAPCPCVADGVMLATSTSPGQGTLRVAAEKSPPGTFGVVVITDRKSGKGLRYAVGENWLAELGAMNRTLDPMGRYDAVMKTDGLFEITPVN